MIRNVFRRWCALPGQAVRRFPLALAFSLLALASAVALHHQSDWGLAEAMEGVLVRLLLLWPFALFGNVCWTLLRERDGRPVLPGLALGGVLLFGAYWILPDQPQNEALGFWFRYYLLVAAMLAFSAGIPARRTGGPDVWDTAWALVLAGFMATLSAMLLVGGMSLALFSVERLFEIEVNGDLYLDMFFVGFFLLGPLTAFAWLPSSFGSPQPQPGWLKGTARIVLTPLCLLYALILVAYMGKVIRAAHWPDGWVAMPTLIFGALGLAAYLIARPARDRAAESWAGRFCRIFPLIMIPLAVILIMAMRVRIADYGFTEWRVIGLALGLYFLVFSTVYSIRTTLSAWWIACSLGLLGGVLSVGQLSAASLSLNSQRERLDALLSVAGVPEGDPVTLEGDVAKRVRSGIQYLLQHHGPEGLPRWVQERWRAEQEDRDPKPDTKPRSSYTRHQVEHVLQALDLTLQDVSHRVWYHVRCDMETLALDGYRDLTLGVPGRTNRLPFHVEGDIRVFAGNDEIARTERDAFIEELSSALIDQAVGEVRLPVEQMSLSITHEDTDYVIVFTELNVNSAHRSDVQPAISHYGGVYLVLRERASGSKPLR